MYPIYALFSIFATFRLHQKIISYQIKISNPIILKNSSNPSLANRLNRLNYLKDPTTSISVYYYRDKSGNNRVDRICSLLISKISSLDKPHVYLHECATYIGCLVTNGLLKNYEKMIRRKWWMISQSGVINLFLIDLIKITRGFMLHFLNEIVFWR